MCRFFKDSSEEERQHAEKLMEYQVFVGLFSFLIPDIQICFIAIFLVVV